MTKKNNKENNTKKIILISITIIAFITSIIFIIMTVNNSKEKNEKDGTGIEVTKNKNIIKDTRVDGLDITDQILYNRNNKSIFSAIITNNTENDYEIGELYIIFDNQKILALRNSTIKKNDKIPLEVTFDSNALDTKKIEYELNK